MARYLIMALATSLLLTGAGCSDDTENPDSGMDAGVDMAPVEASVDQKATEAGKDMPAPKEGGTDAVVKPAKFSGQIAIFQLEGHPMPGAPGPDAGPPVKVARIQVGFDGVGDTTYKPDFVDAPAPPNCVAYKWTKTKGPNQTAYNAGKVSITNHLEPMYVDGNATTSADAGAPVPKQIPKTIDCTRTSLPGGAFTYTCGLPALPVLVSGDLLTDATLIDYTVAGGADIPAFTLKGLKPAPQAKPKSTTKLYDIDPSKAVKIEWETTAAMFVSIDISAMLKDGSEFGRITCVTLAMLGSKTIPTGALAILPKPSATNPLIITTAVMGVGLKQTTGTWGSANAVAGRGTFGVSCRTPAGACP